MAAPRAPNHHHRALLVATMAVALLAALVCGIATTTTTATTATTIRSHGLERNGIDERDIGLLGGGVKIHGAMARRVGEEWDSDAMEGVADDLDGEGIGGRGGAFLSTTGSFTLSSGGNLMGNSEQNE